MFTVRISEKGGAERQTRFDKAEVTIGRIQQNDVVLPKGNVSKHHSRVVLKDGRFLVVDLKSTNGTYVNGKRISTPTVVKPGDKIYIGDFILTVDKSAGQQAETAEAPQQPAASSSLAAPPAMSASGDSSAGFAPSPDPAPPAMSNAIAPPSFASSSAGAVSEKQPNISVPPPLPRKGRTSEPSVASQSAANAFGLGKEPPMVTDPPAPEPRPERPAQARSQPSQSSNYGGADSQQVVGARVSQTSPPINVGPGEQGALRAVMHQLEARFDVHNVAVDGLHDTNRRGQAQTEIDTIISELTHTGALGPEISMDAISKLALREAVGLGCLEALLADDSVNEVCVNGPSDIRIDRGSGPTRSNLFVSSAKMLETLGRRLIAQTRASDEQGAVLEGTLPYGPRVTVLLSPVAPRGPVVEIRRMGKAPTLEDLVSRNMLSQEAAELLVKAVESRVNVAVVGELGSGVTTLLSALASRVDDDERVICVEDVADMQVQGPQVVSLTSGRGSLVDAIRYSAKLRGDRLIVDDVRPADCEEAILGIGARAGGCLIGVHTSPGDDPGEPMRRMTQGNEAAKHLLPQVAPIIVGLDGRLGVTSVVETLKTKSTVLFAREGDVLAKKSDARAL